MLTIKIDGHVLPYHIIQLVSCNSRIRYSLKPIGEDTLGIERLSTSEVVLFSEILYLGKKLLLSNTLQPSLNLTQTLASARFVVLYYQYSSHSVLQTR